MKKLLLVTAFAAISTTASASSLIQNGSFESPGMTQNGYQTVNAGSTLIDGWTVGGMSVDLVKGAYGAITSTSVDMAGSPGPGFMSQSFATTVGQMYQLDFDLSTNGFNQIGVFLNKASQVFSIPMNSVQHFSWLYLADTARTNLMFSSIIGGNSGAVLDNVSVSAVPLPGAALLFGSALFGAGALRRKQAAAKKADLAVA